MTTKPTTDDTDPGGRFARRRAARTTRRDQRRALAQNLRDWRDERRLAATKRRAAARKAGEEARAGKRGVDRVPADLRGLAVSAEPHTDSPVRRNADGTVRRGGREIVTEDRPAGNYETRRRRGQRGHRRKPRRREIRAAGAANRQPDSPTVQQRAATRAARDQARGRS